MWSLVLFSPLQTERSNEAANTVAMQSNKQCLHTALVLSSRFLGDAAVQLNPRHQHQLTIPTSLSAWNSVTLEYDAAVRVCTLLTAAV